MIELQNVTKIYYGKRKKQTIALDGVSFTLPDKGFVFIVGKSGCGKSTLLNMMGGCDKLSGGDVVIDGNKFSQFKESDFDNFRNDYVGFIFQDYCLLERLTVRQNVALALQLQGDDDGSAADEALEQVDMAEYASRMPDELSGGQKQRVAIARTLAKRPKLVLADEPTGNLDAKSTQTVLQLLKKLSENTLVVIVSHNRADAEQYADRIIELSYGKVISDVSRNPDCSEISFGEKEIVIQQGVVFNDEQLAQINRQQGKATIRQENRRFLPTVAAENAHAAPAERIKHKPLSRCGWRTLFAMLAKKRAVSIALTVLSVVFIIAVLGVCQFFTQFSANEEISRLVAQSDGNKTFILQKAHRISEINTTPVTDELTYIPDSDIEAFRSTGYQGEIYPLYNVSLMSHTGGSNLIWDIEAYHMPKDEANYANFYCGSGLGVLVTNEDFLSKLYGDEEGKLRVLSGSLQTEGAAVLLTDYIADSILAYDPTFRTAGDDPYATITNGGMHLAHFRAAGVIYTGYKERYAQLIEKIQNKTFSVKTNGEEYAKLLEELNSTLNIGYSFNPDFYQAYADDEDCPRSVYYGTMEITYGDRKVVNKSYSYRNFDLEPDEIRLARSVYAQLMGIDVNDVNDEEAVGKKITLSRYNYIRNENDAPDYTVEVTVAGLLDDIDGVGGFNCSPELYRLLKQYGNAPYALYFDDMSKVTEVYDMGEELTYVVKNPLVTALYTVSKSTLVFTDIFVFIAIVTHRPCGDNSCGVRRGKRAQKYVRNCRCARSRRQNQRPCVDVRSANACGERSCVHTFCCGNGTRRKFVQFHSRRGLCETCQ